MHQNCPIYMHQACYIGLLTIDKRLCYVLTAFCIYVYHNQKRCIWMIDDLYNLDKRQRYMIA